MLSYKILSFDPGLCKCGYAVLEININDEIKLITADTIMIEKEVPENHYVAELHSYNMAKLVYLDKKVNELLELYKPSFVASEIGFFNPRRPSAFETLVSVVTVISNCVFRFDPTIYFTRIPAAKVKSNLGVCGKSGDKSLVLEAVIKRNLSYENINLRMLGPDSIDAIAVGLYASDMLIKL